MTKPPVLLDGTGGSNNFWPPWPWPPWGDDDDDDEDKDTRSPEERAHGLAEQIVKFESRVANASLDLYVFIVTSVVLIQCNCCQGYSLPRSGRNIQSPPHLQSYRRSP
jgi:hypothetical protein